MSRPSPRHVENTIDNQAVIRQWGLAKCEAPKVIWTWVVRSAAGTVVAAAADRDRKTSARRREGANEKHYAASSAAASS